jgi:hypothetical protein
MTPRFQINNLGEIFIRDACVSGSVNIVELEQRLGRTHTQRDIEQHFDREARAVLDDEAFALYKLHTRALHRLHTNLVRFSVRNGQLWASTEFIAFTDDRAAWKRIRNCAQACGAAIRTMTRHPHLDQWKHDGDAKWTTGPNHGRMEKQVELVLACRTFDEAKRAKRLYMTAAKAQGADLYWVSVI